MRTGFITVVTLDDGRQLLVTDATRLKDCRVEFGVRERIAYYLSTVGLNDKSRREGVDSVILISPKGLANEERFPEMMKRIHVSLPMIAKSMVTIPILDEAGREHLVEYFSYLLLRTNETLSPETLAGCSSCISREQALQKLEERGINRIYLPTRAGGSSLFDSQLDNWIRMRLSIEDSMSSALPLQNLLPSKPDRSAKGLTEMIRRPASQESKEAFLRKRNAMYSRRRTQKFKIQQVALGDQKKLLEAENAKLRKENEKLEVLLAQANLQVSLANVGAYNSKLQPSIIDHAFSNSTPVGLIAQSSGSAQRITSQNIAFWG